MDAAVTEKFGHAGPAWLVKNREVLIDALILVLIWVFLLSFFEPHYLFSQTITTGGDTGSHFYTAKFLKDNLLPLGRITGWCPGNYAGYPVFQFYFPLPFVLMAFLAYLIPLTISFKLISIAGVMSLPLCAYAGLRKMGAPFPGPIFAAILTLPFLFMQENSMWGGNIPSTLAGEFAYGIGLSLMILYFGYLYGSIDTRRGIGTCAVILALTGFSHGYTLVFAVIVSSFFLFTTHHWWHRLAYLLKVGTLAFFLMGFWIVPLQAFIPYTTRYNYVWIIDTFRQVVPPILWPAAGLGVLGAGLTALRNLRPGVDRTSLRADLDRLIFFVFILIAATVFYFIAYRISVVDIRFIPFGQTAICLISALGLAALISRLKATWLLPMVVFIVVVLGLGRMDNFIPGWIKWNYQGFEKTPAWPSFKAVNDYLKGTEADPRVVYEHSDIHNKAGTTRAFESLPLFSGRSTLEGLYMQSTISSPFAFYIQSEVSKVTSAPLPDYNYSRFNLDKGIKHLRLFNVSRYIVAEKVTKAAARVHPELEFEKQFGEYEIYKVKGNAGHYVTPVKFEPVLMITQNWRKAAFQWFRVGDLEVPVVFKPRQDPGDEKRFQTIRTNDNIADLPRIPLVQPVKVAERVTRERVDIITNRVGHPLLIKISYHPNWQVIGADRVYPASPSLMIIYPTSEHVTLYYDSTWPNKLGAILTILGLMWLVAYTPPVARRLAGLHLPTLEGLAPRLFPGVTGWFGRHGRRVLLVTVLALTLSLTIIIIRIHHLDATIVYNEGQAKFRIPDYAAAAEIFKKGMDTFPYSPIVDQTAFHYGLCYYNRQDWTRAAEIFSKFLAGYPESNLYPEILYHLAACYDRLNDKDRAKAAYRLIIKEFSKSTWAGEAQRRLDEADGTGADYNLARGLFDQGKYREAARMFQQLADRYRGRPEGANARYFQAAGLFKAADWAGAAAIFEQLTIQDPAGPWTPEAIYHLGLCAVQRGDKPGAKVYFQRVIDDHPGRWAKYAGERLAELGPGS
ncbi:MAG: tetratricopeptide repeat protein [Deltaproteobacteria bacterium]|nr:tetratricopeptide repeat protein [Deltaproteobacteria bacterium]